MITALTRKRQDLVRQLPRLALVLLVALIAGCKDSATDGTPPKSTQKQSTGPAAQLFEKMLREIKTQRDLDPESHRKSNYDLLTVKVEDWLATDEGRVAHALKIPNPVPEDSGYKPGMTQQQYFEHLCKTEAGEFIFKTADSVEGIYQMRMRKFMYGKAEWQHLYAIEDPYGYWAGENDNPGREFVGPSLYSFLEAPPALHRREYGFRPDLYDSSLARVPPPDAKIARWTGYNGKDSKSQRLEYDSKPKAKYGFTWRGIKRPHDREFGIAGGELIVLDLKTNEVMGVRRGYTAWNVGWGRVCPRYGYSGGQDKTTFFSMWFLAKVARPPKWKSFFEGREEFRIVPEDSTNKQ